MTRRLRIIVHGDVQGVFYRVSCKKQAEQLGLVGFVRNEQDGTVLIEAQGTSEALAELSTWCQEGSPAANVQAVEVQDVEPTTDSDFSII